MSEVKVSEIVAAPATKVWELLGDFGGVMKWSGPMMQSCQVEGEGVGAVRRIGLTGGMEISERCEAVDATARSLSYSIIGKSPLPLRDYFSTVSVTETGASECRVDWNGRFEAAGVSEEQAQGMVRGIYTGGIAAVKKRLGA